MEVRAFHSAQGNNQFTLSPLRVPPQPYCEFINKFYRKYLMESLKEPVSDFPYTSNEAENVCNFFEKVLLQNIIN